MEKELSPNKVAIFVRSSYNYNTDDVSEQNSLSMIDQETGEIMPSKTQQQFAEDADINNIVERFGLTGQLPENLQMPVSGDFTDVVDYQTAMNLISKARDEFYTVPAHIRAEFDNDPQKLMKFLENDKNRERALEMGLIKPPPEQTRDVIQAIDELKTTLTPPKTA